MAAFLCHMAFPVAPKNIPILAPRVLDQTLSSDLYFRKLRGNCQRRFKLGMFPLLAAAGSFFGDAPG